MKNEILFKDLYENVRIWTVNEPNEIKQLLDMKVNAIITDFPEVTVSIRNVWKGCE